MAATLRSLVSALGAAFLIAECPQPAAAGPRDPSSPDQPSAPLAGSFAQRITSQNLLAVTISNFGSMGNGFVTRAASFEYPAGAGFEHMTYGGLWIGGRALDANGAFTGVTTAMMDVALGPIAPSFTEFTPLGTAIQVRSSLPASPFFDPAAVSEQDFISEYDDLTPKQAAGNPELHRPLRVRVRQENYTWSFSDYAHVLFFHYVIRNVGAPLADVWVGLFTELASGKKSGYVNWPPSSADPSGLGSWFSKKWIAYNASQRLFREHYCRALPIPTGCNLTLVPYWVGLQLLGARPGSLAPGGDKHVTLAAWSWAPGNPLRDQDVERYAIMSAGTINPLSDDSLQPQTGDPVELLAVGPFPSIGSGDSISVDFALVGGSQVADLEMHAALAQQAYDMGYAILPTPVLISLVGARAEPGMVRLGWRAASAGFEGTVWRSDPGGEWTGIADVGASGTGLIAYDDRDVRAGGRYGYRLAERGAPASEGSGEAWVEVPAAAGFALEGLRPNPALGGELTVSFALGSNAPATIELLDVGGRRVFAREVGSLGPGSHQVKLDGSGIRPGLYFIRLTQGIHTATRRAVVTE